MSELRKAVEYFIERAKRLKVLVIGETIIDEFIDVSYEGQSMKSICPVFKLEGGALRQQGGASAVEGHLRDFVAKVDIVTNTNEEIIKTRYVDVADRKKHVEINRFGTTGFPQVDMRGSEHDVVIVADFGHGFCDRLKLDDGFHLMCQTNSNNFGFNRISKWKAYRKKSACVDLREASLQVNKRIASPSDSDIREIYNYELNCNKLFITAGKHGSFSTDGERIRRQPSFETTIVDTIGAGDTFFAFACIIAHLDDPEANDLLVPSLAASLSTTWLCNEQSVTKKKLLEHADSYVSE
jgi:bifunctional ADP-heptose synthase (sugar kinase/adenylyltransferase)